MKAEEENINLSMVVETAIVDELKKRKKKHWSLENPDSIDSYNNLLDTVGTFSDGLRSVQ